MTDEARKRTGASVEVFDPRKGQDFCIPHRKHGGVLFSSCDHGCVVIRMSWKKGWWVKKIPIAFLNTAIVNTVLQATGDIGFLSVYPGDSLGRFAGLGELEVHKCGDALFFAF